MKKTVEYISAQKAAKKWRTSERLAQKYCQDGRVEGAKKFGNSWAIPADARKPIDPYFIRFTDALPYVCLVHPA